jgi:hypothetical protein
MKPKKAERPFANLAMLQIKTAFGCELHHPSSLKFGFHVTIPMKSQLPARFHPLR